MLITELPEEVLQDIFAELDPKSLRQCTQACKAFYGLVEDSVALQYKFALDLAGYIDGPPTNLISTAERLRRLTEHQKAWRDLSKWRQVDHYRVDNKSTTYELYGGVYAQGTQNIQSGSFYTRGFELIEFPSLLRNMPEGHTWSIGDLGFDVKDFGMDPDRNLLVAIETTPRKTWNQENPAISIHLLTLREEDARAHPLAAAPILKYRPQSWHPTYNFWVQVSGDLLAILFRPGTDRFDEARPEPPIGDELVIWGWRTGKVVMRIRFGKTIAQSFSFLANDLILVPCVIDQVRPVLKLYRLPHGASSSGELVARFGCPPMRDTILRCYVICRNDPSPYAPAPRGPSRKEDSKAFDDIQVVWPAHGAAPFAPHPRNRLIVLSFSLIVRTQVPAGQVEARGFTGFAKAKTFLSLWQDGVPGKDGIVDVPWEDWGPQNTRFLAEEADENCVCYVYGMRYGSMVDINGDRVVRILDFNDAEFSKEAQKSDRHPEGPRDPFANASALEAQPVVLESEMRGELAAIETVEDGDDDDEWTDESTDSDDERIRGFRGLKISKADARHHCEQLRIAYEPSYLIDNAVFESKLETRLPFRWTLTPEADQEMVGSFLRVMIDDEHVIGVKVSDLFRLIIEDLTADQLEATRSNDG